jgi:hypothetical protein
LENSSGGVAANGVVIPDKLGGDKLAAICSMFVLVEIRQIVDGIDFFLLKSDNRRVWDTHLSRILKEHSLLSCSQWHPLCSPVGSV